MVGCYKREMRQQERREEVRKIEGGAGKGGEWMESVDYEEGFCMC